MTGNVESGFEFVYVESYLLLTPEGIYSLSIPELAWNRPRHGEYFDVRKKAYCSAIPNADFGPFLCHYEHRTSVHIGWQHC